MQPAERLKRLRALFDAAVDLAPTEQALFVAAECATDTALRTDLEGLLRREQQIKGAHTQSPVGEVERGLEFAAVEIDRSQQFDPYQLEEEIGSGGMGRVFRGRRIDGAFEQEVAIKLMRRELMNPALLKRFSTERTVLAALDHPGISRLIDAGETADGTPYVVMELVRGLPLLDYCDQRRLTIAQRVALFRQVVDAVAHAHRNLVVHRDLKPGNVLVTENGTPKLLDFGIAKPLSGESGATLTADRFFTPAYAAPEQLRGGPITVGCDVYALGVLLFELLTGRLPFLTENLSPGEIERLIVSVPPPAMHSVVALGNVESAAQRGTHDTRQLRRHLSGDLEAIVQRALRKEPRERYATVEQLDADLAAFLENRPVAASGGQRWYRLRKFVARNRFAVGLAAAATIALTATLVTIVRQTIEVRHERDRAQYALKIMEDAFISADPAQAAGADVTARQILDAALPRIEELFETQPALYASLASSLARVQLRLRMAPEAAELAGRAALAAESSGADSGTLRRILLLDAEALGNAGKHEEADRSLARLAQLVTDDDPEWNYVRGRVYTLNGRAREALPVLERAIAALGSRPPTDDLTTRVRWQLSETLRVAGEDAKALGNLDAVLQWQRSALPNDHARVAQSRLRRIDLLRALGRTAEALSESQSLVLEFERLYGKNSAFVASAQGMLGNALIVLDRSEEAARAYQAAVEGFGQALGSEHPTTLRMTFNLARALAREPARHDAADQAYRETLAGAQRRLEARSELLFFFRFSYAEFLLRRGLALEALEVLSAPETRIGLEPARESYQKAYRAALSSSYAATCAKSGMNSVTAVTAENPRQCAEAASWIATNP